MALVLSPLMLAACATPYEAEPTSAYQWERRQEQQRRDYCRGLDAQSAAWKRDCGRAGDPR